MSLPLDLLIALGLLVIAQQMVASASVFRAIMLFIVFGLLMALAWARLHAPDLALAEAAIGAGITGALLLVTWRRIEVLPGTVQPRAPRPRWLAAMAAVASVLLVGAVGWAALDVPAAPAVAGELAWDAMDDLGVGNPVTGVLLAFRAYDTLMEMGVLLAAWLGARAVTPGTRPGALPGPAHAEVPLVGALLSMVVPTSFLVAVYLVQTGGSAPGGAFQGGAVLAAGGVLLCLSGRLQPATHTPILQRIGLVIGLVTFSVMGLIALALDQAMLGVLGTWAIYLIESALLVSIALTLVMLFAAVPGLQKGGPG